MAVIETPPEVVQSEMACDYCGAPAGNACLTELADGSIRILPKPHASRYVDHAMKNRPQPEG